eukprot:CAMPEP_0182830120 /NCGR_PEP_ID=MMETSP0006_2-20121128/18405_1 /TAXON_ID=97485 /ORGANISM="Prymnesium parvum, Strain Texoma1" /LENGTH=31 /DNA_ID= /DNA_START= /DNA_END= /DNA_ORIENTATION=
MAPAPTPAPSELSSPACLDFALIDCPLLLHL